MATSVVSESLRKTGFRMTRQRRIVEIDTNEDDVVDDADTAESY